MATNGESRPEATTQDERRGQMLTAAAQLISERGFAQTRIVDVAQRVGVSPGLVVYYFETKDKLLTAALVHSESAFYQAAYELLDAKTNLAQRLETLVDLTFESNGNPDVPVSWGLWFDLWGQAYRHPQVAVDRAALDEQWRNLIVRIVRAGVESSEIGDVDAAEFAAAWAALLDGLSIQVALEDPVVTAPRAKAMALRFASRELGL